MYHLFAPSLWYLIPIIICERCHKFFISWAIWNYKLVYPLGVTLEKDQETWLPDCNSTFFWVAYFLIRLCCLKHSFGAWYLCCGLASKAFVYDKDSVGIQLLIIRIRKKILLQNLTLNRDWDFFCKKPEHIIHNWTQNMCGRY